MSAQPDTRQQRTPGPRQRGWGRRYDSNSIYARLNPEQRRAYEKWLKQLDGDLGQIERWARNGAG